MTLVMAPLLAKIAEAQGGEVEGHTYFLMSFVPYVFSFIITIIIVIHIRNMFKVTETDQEEEESSAGPGLSY